MGVAPGASGNFFLDSGPAAKQKAKSRSSAFKYPLFSQLSQFISDDHWSKQFQKYASDNLPQGFRIRDGRLSCQKNQKAYRIPLVFIGINDQAGLNGLNINLLQLLQQNLAIPLATPGGANLMTPLRIEALAASVRYHSHAPQNAAVWSSGFDPHQLAPYYITSSLLEQQSTECVVLQNYIISIIEFVKCHTNLGSPDDLQRQQAQQIVHTNAALANWADYDKRLRETLYEGFLCRLVQHYKIPQENAEEFKTHMRLYYYYNNIPAEWMQIENGELTGILGLDLSQGLPPLRQIKSSGSNRVVQDAALKHWKKYVGAVFGS